MVERERICVMKRLLFWGAVALAGATTCTPPESDDICDDAVAQDSGVAERLLKLKLRSVTDETPLPRWLPWVEVNAAPPSPAYDTAISGAQRWAAICSTICISTAPANCKAVYCALRDDLPDMMIVPGIKTGPALGSQAGVRIDDVGGWAEIAEAVALAARICENQHCVLENETGWADYLTGEYEPDWEAVRNGLLQLEQTGVRLVWYPAAVFADEAWFARAQRFIELLVATNPDVTLITYGWYRPAAVRNPIAQDRQRWNESLGVACLDICYFYPETVRPGDWRAHQLGYVIDNCPLDFLLYPGLKHWSECGRLCVEELRPQHAEPEGSERKP
jgi:hypothetical protein